MHSKYLLETIIPANHLLTAAIEEAGDDCEFLFHYLTFDERYYEFKLIPSNPFLDDTSINVRSALTNDWTIKMIRVPGPNKGADKLGRKKISQDVIFDFLNLSGVKNKPMLVEQLLSIETGSKEHEKRYLMI